MFAAMLSGGLPQTATPANSQSYPSKPVRLIAAAGAFERGAVDSDI